MNKREVENLLLFLLLLLIMGHVGDIYPGSDEGIRIPDGGEIL
jgi:hypothetical protein